MNEDQTKHVMLALLKDNMREMNMLAAIKFEPNDNEHPSDKELAGGGDPRHEVLSRFMAALAYNQASTDVQVFVTKLSLRDIVISEKVWQALDKITIEVKADGSGTLQQYRQQFRPMFNSKAAGIYNKSLYSEDTDSHYSLCAQFARLALGHYAYSAWIDKVPVARFHIQSEKLEGQESPVRRFAHYPKPTVWLRAANAMNASDVLRVPTHNFAGHMLWLEHGDVEGLPEGRQVLIEVVEEDGCLAVKNRHEQDHWPDILSVQYKPEYLYGEAVFPTISDLLAALKVERAAKIDIRGES